MSERVGLTTLVERVCLRLIDPTEEESGDRIHFGQFGDLSLCGECLRMAWVGCMVSAWWKSSAALKAELPELPGLSPQVLQHDYAKGRDDDIDDERFWQTIGQVSRLDDFLFTLETDPRCRPLARDCRDDLALLNVLADWCEDNGRLAAAAEARHLGALVASILRE